MVAIGLTGLMGDIVACEPVIARVRERHPQAAIVWCAAIPFVSLLKKHPLLDRVIGITCIGEWVRLRDSGLFDAVVDLHVHRAVCPICQARVIKTNNFDAISVSTYLDHGSLLGAFAKGAGLGNIDDAPKLYLPPEVVLPELPPCVAVLHPVSTHTSKEWPGEKWEHLLDLIANPLAERGITAVEIGKGRACFKPRPGLVSMVNRLRLVESAALIARAELFIGIDSGPAHIANASATPGVVLLGDFMRFRGYTPYSGGYADGSLATLVRIDGAVAQISVDAVVEAVIRRLKN